MNQNPLDDLPAETERPSIGLQIVFGILVAGFVHAAALFAVLAAIDTFRRTQGSEASIIALGIVVDVLVSAAIVLSQVRKHRGWFIGTFIAISAAIFLAIGSCALMLSTMRMH